MTDIHVFDNGIRVYSRHLMPAQRERYRRHNVHEADEEAIFTRIIAALPADGVYVDIGSAIGYYVMLARKLAPDLSIHAVEPLARFRACLSENLLLNELSDDDFVIHPVGVSDQDGKVEFVAKGFESRVLSDEDKGFKPSAVMRKVKEGIKALLGRLGIKRYAEGAGEQTVIDAVTLDTLIGRIGGPVDLVQMDVQGLELAILEGGAETLDAADVRTFIIGTHSRSLHRRCIDLLARHGYVIEHDEPDTPNQPDGIIVASKGVRRLA